MTNATATTTVPENAYKPLPPACPNSPRARWAGRSSLLPVLYGCAGLVYVTTVESALA